MPVRRTRSTAPHATAGRHIPLVVLLAGLAPAAGAQEAPDAEEMWRIIQEQQRQIENLESQLRSAEQKTEQTEEKVEATARMVEQQTQEAAGYGAAPGWWQRTHIGGYGEVHYNNLENDSTGEDFEQVDVHRLVLEVGHEFTDWLRLFTEVELEHALVEDTDDGSGPGEVELEQAWIEADYLPGHRVRAGVDLIPVGILNITHEPPTFFGVERNPVESNIIPTTWWEAGIGGLGEIAPGWNYHVVLHSGLETSVAGDSAFLIRSGRNKVARAAASNGAATGQLRYTGMPGIEVGLTGQYQADVTQGEQDIEGTLLAAHVDARRGPFGLRALYARWDLDDGPAGLGPGDGSSPGRDEQYGWYVEPAYFVQAPGRIPGEFGFFTRFNQWDNNAGSGGGDTRNEQLDVGFNYWPHPDVVFKFDYQEQMDNADFDGFNLGVGFQF